MKEKHKDAVRIVFWNAAGIKNLEDIIEHIQSTDIACISETWVENTTTLK